MNSLSAGFQRAFRTAPPATAELSAKALVCRFEFPDRIHRRLHLEKHHDLAAILSRGKPPGE